jgi:DNA polymerase-3 subunit delta
MPSIEAKQFYAEVDEGRCAPLYFLFGDEPYLLNQSIDRLKSTVVNEATADFNLNVFYAGDADVSTIRDSVEMLAMMAPRRLVIVKEAQDFTDKEWASLESLFANPVESTVFVLTASKIDRRKKSVKLLLDHAHTVEFKRPYENQIPTWINYIAGTHGLEVSEEAIHLLHKLVGSHLQEIDSEIKKLKDFVGDRTNIEVSDVSQVVSHVREESIFDLTRAIGENDRVRALEHLVRLLDQGQSEVGIVSMVARHIRLLTKIKYGQEKGLFGAKLAQWVQVPPYFVNDYIEQSKTWTVRRLEDMILILDETDKALKSSPLSSHIWLENLILKGCNKTAQPSYA